MSACAFLVLFLFVVMVVVWMLAFAFALEDGVAVTVAVAGGGLTTDPDPALKETLAAEEEVATAGGTGAGLPIQCTTEPSSNLKSTMTFPSSREGIIFPLKMRRMEDSGMVVALDASWWSADECAGEGSSIGRRRGGFVREREMVSLSLFVILLLSLN